MESFYYCFHTLPPLPASLSPVALSEELNLLLHMQEVLSEVLGSIQFVAGEADGHSALGCPSLWQADGSQWMVMAWCPRVGRVPTHAFIWCLGSIDARWLAGYICCIPPGRSARPGLCHFLICIYGGILEGCVCLHGWKMLAFPDRQAGHLTANLGSMLHSTDQDVRKPLQMSL